LATVPASAQTTLRWKFQPGQTLQQTITQDTKTSITVAEQVIETTVNQVIDATWNVGQVDAEGNAQVTQEIKRIRMKLGGMMNLEIDSASEVPAQGIGAMLGPAIQAMAKAKFQMKMTPRGEILEVEVSQEALDGLKSLPGGGQIANMITKDSLINMIKQGTPSMPAGAVRAGDSWNSSTEMAAPQIGTMISDTKLTYGGPEVVDGRPLERIDLEMTLKLAPPKEAAAVAITIKDQQAAGKLYFDNQTGRLDHSELVQNMTMQVTAGGQRFEQKIQTTMHVQLVPATP
jgi:hypothetical protein